MFYKPELDLSDAWGYPRCAIASAINQQPIGVLYQRLRSVTSTCEWTRC